MITIKTSQKLVNFIGEPLKQGEQDITVGDAISIALGGKTTNPTLAWVLGKKFANDKEVELKAEDVVFVKESMNSTEHWADIVKGQVIEILETPTTPVVNAKK